MTTIGGQRVPRPFTPHWSMLHHTASPPWSSPAANLAVVVHGNSVAPGPIAQLLVDRGGVVSVVAAGAANHAGAGRLPDGSTNGNGEAFGVEQVNAGAAMTFTGSRTVRFGVNTFELSLEQWRTWTQLVEAGTLVEVSPGVWWEVWSRAQLEASARVQAAILGRMGWGTDRLVTHARFAPGRKVDPAGPWWDDPERPLDHVAWLRRFVDLVDELASEPEEGRMVRWIRGDQTLAVFAVDGSSVSWVSPEVAAVLDVTHPGWRASIEVVPVDLVAPFMGQVSS